MISTWEERQDTPLSVPTIIHRIPFAIKSKSAGQKALIKVGINFLKDIMDRQGNLLDWDQRKQQ